MPPRPGRYIVRADPKSITAHYDPGKPGKLTLKALAQVPPYVHDVDFEQDFLWGGLKFDLGGSFGAPESGPIKEEEITGVFDLTLTLLTTPSHYLLVVIQDHPNGVPVPIDGWPPLQEGDAASQPPPVPIDAAPGNPVTDVLDTPFKITQALGELNPTSSITVTYDKEYVKLLSSRIEGTSIVWELEGIKLGHTDVTVGVGSRHPPWFYIVQHSVNIVNLKD